MGIRSKLFLSIGLLFLLTVILIFFLQRHFTQKDISQSATQIQELIQNDRIFLEDKQKNILGHSLDFLQQDINSILTLIAVSQTSSSPLLLEGLNEKDKWSLAAQLLSYNPAFGWVMIRQEDDLQNKTVAISSQNASLYPALAPSDNRQNGSISVSRGGVSQLYKAIAITSTSSKKGIYYLLVSEEQPSLEGQLPQSVGFPQENPQWKWALKMELLRILAAFYGEARTQKKEEKKNLPLAVAWIDLNTQEGMALFSDEVFPTQPVLNDNSCIGAPSNFSVNKTPLIFLDQKEGEIYLGNTLCMQQYRISLGASLIESVRMQAEAFGIPLIVTYKGRVWGAQLKKEKQGVSFVENTFPLSVDPEQEKGSLLFFGQKYDFIRHRPYPTLPLDIYFLSEKQKEHSIMNILSRLDKELTDRISYQMLLVMGSAFLLALFILSRLSTLLTAPLAKLSHATGKVTQGDYESIDLPKVKNSKDEIAVLTKAFAEMIEGLKEREKIRAVLNKVVSKDIADEILKTTFHLGGEDRIVTMLFSDIRSFTNLTANFPPQKTISMLNAYMTKMSRVIEGEGGIIDKYVGDEIMALFGAPSPHPDHAVRALSSAKLMIETLKQWNIERQANGEPLIEMGIGIHTGLVVAGNMGAEDRLNYTVLGANVNLAARLCQSAKPMQIIISEMTLEQPNVKESFYVKPLEPISLKGFANPVNIYEIVGFKWT